MAIVRADRDTSATAIGLTLTLAGVTGIIVSVGVTVDSYVVYFERLKDEVRSGKTVARRSTAAFTASFRTILAADLVSLIGAARALRHRRSARCEGFAFFLGLSTILDLARGVLLHAPAGVDPRPQPAARLACRASASAASTPPTSAVRTKIDAEGAA